MPKNIYTVRCIERVYSYYIIEAESEEAAINSACKDGQFLEYGDFIDTDMDSLEVESVRPFNLEF
jgi:hypothetical protein